MLLGLGGGGKGRHRGDMGPCPPPLPPAHLTVPPPPYLSSLLPWSSFSSPCGITGGGFGVGGTGGQAIRPPPKKSPLSPQTPSVLSVAVGSAVWVLLLEGRATSGQPPPQIITGPPSPPNIRDGFWGGWEGHPPLFSGRTGLSGGWGRREGSCGWGEGKRSWGAGGQRHPQTQTPPPKETP